MAVTPNGDACVTCSTDKSARLFKVPFAPLEAGPVERDVSAVLEFHGKFGFRALDHHVRDTKFATAGEKVRLWRIGRLPLRTYRLDGMCPNWRRFAGGHGKAGEGGGGRYLDSHSLSRSWHRSACTSSGLAALEWIKVVIL